MTGADPKAVGKGDEGRLHSADGDPAGFRDRALGGGSTGMLLYI